MASTDPTARVETAACLVGRCWTCKGTVFSVLDEVHGQPCQHECHLGDDLATEAMLEARHFGYGDLADDFGIDF